jgi:hypothetical protein
MGDPHEDAKRGLKRPRGSNGTGEVADWSFCDAELLQKAISKAGFKHCALRFGYSRDGGAYAIGVYAGVDYFTDYIRPGEDIDQYLRDLILSLEEYSPQDPMQPQSKRKKG